MADELGTEGTEETQGFDDIGDDEEVGGEEFVEDEQPNVDTTFDPNEVAKWRETHEKFTQKTQALSAQQREVQQMRDELAPLSRLRTQLENDPGLVRAIEGYFMKEGNDPQVELASMKQELDNVKTTIAVEKELADVAKWVRQEGLPSFDETELLEYAGQNRILNLKAAYRDMNFDKVQNRKAEQLTEDIKRGKGAAVPKSRRADTGGKVKYSEDDIAAMTDEEFQKNFGSIMGSFQ